MSRQLLSVDDFNTEVRRVAKDTGKDIKNIDLAGAYYSYALLTKIFGKVKIKPSCSKGSRELVFVPVR